MAFASPDQLRLWLVGQGGQSEAGVGEADLLGVFGQHLVGGFHQQAFVLRLSPPSGLLDTFLEDQLVHPRHDTTMAAWVLSRNVESGSTSYLKDYLILQFACG